MKFLKRTIGIIIVMAAIISGLQLKSELAYGATPTISKSTVTLEKGKRKKLKVKMFQRERKLNGEHLINLQLLFQKMVELEL